MQWKTCRALWRTLHDQFLGADWYELNNYSYSWLYTSSLAVMTPDMSTLMRVHACCARMCLTTQIMYYCYILYMATDDIHFCEEQHHVSEIVYISAYTHAIATYNCLYS